MDENMVECALLDEAEDGDDYFEYIPKNHGPVEGFIDYWGGFNDINKPSRWASLDV